MWFLPRLIMNATVHGAGRGSAPAAGDHHRGCGDGKIRLHPCMCVCWGVTPLSGIREAQVLGFVNKRTHACARRARRVYTTFGETPDTETLGCSTGWDSRTFHRLYCNAHGNGSWECWSELSESPGEVGPRCGQVFVTFDPHLGGRAPAHDEQQQVGGSAGDGHGGRAFGR